TQNSKLKTQNCLPHSPLPQMKAYEYHHIVSFEETNLVGNVYYANYILWQGRCREMFLRDRSPGIIKELSQGLALVTVRVSCDYLSELYAFDNVAIRMRLRDITQNRITMLFEYWRMTDEGEELVAKGEQQAACMRRQGEKMVATPIPNELQSALALYTES
ncbi:acyl-CoA thioesterase, partial [Symplocastrum sp. BBK-W-15]